MVDTDDNVAGRSALIFAADGFEDLELLYPMLRFREAGMDVTVAGLGDKVCHGKKGHPVEVDEEVSSIADEQFDVVFVPGGIAPDKLRTSEDVLRIVRTQDESGRLLAAICHAGWVLASARVLEGRTVTGFRSTQDDLVNAGATYVDEQVVVDNNLVTSRNPDDLPAFCKTILGMLVEQKVPVNR